jgi:hypothetical protein
MGPLLIGRLLLVQIAKVTGDHRPAMLVAVIDAPLFLFVFTATITPGPNN